MKSSDTASAARTVIGIAGTAMITLAIVLPHLSSVVAALLFDLGAVCALSFLILYFVELRERKRHGL